jgi:hypothetical protein
MCFNKHMPSSRQRWLDLISKASKIIKDLAGAIKAILDIFR